MGDLELQPPPKRTKRAKTDLTGPEVGQALKKMNVSTGQFCRLTGVNESRLKRQIKGQEEEKPPIFYEIVLFALYHFPVLRTWKDPIPLPFEEWGIDIETVED